LIVTIPTTVAETTRIIGYQLIGQVESAGNTASLTSSLIVTNAVASDPVEVVLGDNLSLSFTADTELGATSASSGYINYVSKPDDVIHFYITGTTAASTDIVLQGIILYYEEI